MYFKGSVMTWLFIIIAVAAISFFLLTWKSAHAQLSNYILSDAHEFPALLPRSSQEIKKLSEDTQRLVKQELDKILAIPAQERTFENTVYSFDRIGNLCYGVPSRIIHLLSMVSPDSSIRESAAQEQQTLSSFSIDTLRQNKAVYQMFQDYVQQLKEKGEQLNTEQQYYLDEVMKGFKQLGLHLPDEQQATIKKLLKKTTELSITFEKNIAEDTKTLVVSQEELDGMDDAYRSQLTTNDEGKYVLKLSYPIYFPLMEYCHVESTRKKAYTLFNSRAYPQNIALLQELISTRAQLAQLLGYDSYAAFSISDEMAQSPKNVEAFLESLIAPGQKKIAEELAELKAELPESIELVDGKFKPWDFLYTQAHIKKKKYQIDEREIAEYFPMHQTITGLLHVYEKFMGIQFKQVSLQGLWDETLHTISVERCQNGQKKILGYLVLDLHPRANKYSHACQTTVIPSSYDHDQYRPGIAVVIANFPCATAQIPSLLKFNDVSTFFHEFGHALHALLGATHMLGFSGTAVKTDFVEMPSQMLEEWLYSKEILTMISHHYKTKEALPDHLIKKIINLKNFGNGHWVLRQTALSLLSLRCYKEDAIPDIEALMHDIFKSLTPYVLDVPENHFVSSFGHLTGYGAAYYSYLWSKIFALDLFYHIKEFGLLNADIGSKYVREILQPGGSKDPNILLETFLGRKPNSDAFFKDLGLQ